MSANLQTQLISWLGELESRKGTDLLLVESEPVLVRTSGVSNILERLPTQPLMGDELHELAFSLLGEHQVRELGSVRSIAYAAVQVGETAVAMSAARSSGRLSIQVKPLKPFVLNAKQIRTPESVLRAVEEPGGGLVVATGPVGCGKTTTAYILIEHINAERPVHIVLAEYYSDWVFESKRACIQRRQVGLDAPDMVSAIHSAIVQDADVIFVGEIRDVETAMACLQATEGGRLVITQLHEPTPQAAIERLATLEPGNPGQSRRLLARHLRAVVAQRLLPHAAGGRRVPAHGVLIPDQEMRQAIADAQDLLIRKLPLPPGCVSLNDDLASLVREGLVTREAAAAVI